jgi:hypothetical protein
MNDAASADLQRALELSRALLAAATLGESKAVTSIDAERLQLLQSARRGAKVLDASQRTLLQEIAILNDESIGLLEHYRRIKGRELEVAAVGRRAVKAYGSTRLLR